MKKMGKKRQLQHQGRRDGTPTKKAPGPSGWLWPYFMIWPDDAALGDPSEPETVSSDRGK